MCLELDRGVSLTNAEKQVELVALLNPCKQAPLSSLRSAWQSTFRQIICKQIKVKGMSHFQTHNIYTFETEREREREREREKF